MVTKTYVRNSGRLGPLSVQIDGRTARVFSIIGSKSYSFEKLPINYDNRCSILKFAVKHYFDEILDGCQAIKNMKRQTSVSRIINFFFPKAKLPNGPGVQETLCCEVYNNQNEYDWERLDGFVEYKGAENAAEALKLLPVVAFIGFNQECFGGNSYQYIAENPAVKLEIESSNKEKTRCLENFVSGEVSFYLKMVYYREKINNGQYTEDFSYFYEIVDAHNSMIEKYIYSFGLSFVNILTKEQCKELEARGITIDYGTEQVITHTELSILSISKLLVEHHNLFMPYKAFVGCYESILEFNKHSVDLRDCFTAIIQKITGYLQTAKSFLKYDNSLPVKMFYRKFANFNAHLNEVAERVYLDNEKNKLQAMCKGAPKYLDILDSRLLGCVTNLKHGNNEVHIYVFSRKICFFTNSYQYSMDFDVDLVDIYFFDKKMFIFIETNVLRGSLFSKIESTKLSFAVFQFGNRETAAEFRNIFYTVKYDAYKQGNIYRRSDVNAYTGILVSNVQDSVPPVVLDGSMEPEGSYVVKIEYSDLQISPASRYTESEIFSQINYLNAAKNASLENTEGFLLRQRVLMENISEVRLTNFTIFSYNEDNITFANKVEIFNRLVDALHDAASKNTKEENLVNDKHAGVDNFRFTDSPETDRDKIFNSILYEDDILKAYCPGSIPDYLSQYILILHSGAYVASAISRLSGSFIFVTFCVFIQRNLYTFLSPSDIAAVSFCIEQKQFDRIISSVSLRNRSNMENILSSACAMYSKCPDLSRLTIRLISPVNTSDDVIERVLSYIKQTVFS